MKGFFWKRKQSDPVDAVAEIAAAETLSDDRGRPRLDGARHPIAPGAKAFALLLLLVLAMLVVVIVLRVIRSGEAAEKVSSTVTPKIGSVLPELKLRDPTPPPSPVAPEPPPAPPPAPEPALAEVTKPTVVPRLQVPMLDPIEQRQLSSGLRAENSDRRGSTATPPRQAPAVDTGPMAEQLQPLRLHAARAGLMGNRDLLLTQGAMIDCVQQTKFISAQAGMITCHATRDVRSASGRVVLIDAGTIFTGYQRGVLAHGQPRIGIVWTRLETPSGVVVHLDSPGTGPLGEAGLDGEIDTHFAQRFGAAIMISLIDDLGSWIANRGSNNQGNNIRFDSTSDAAQQAVTTVLENTVNIPPTLYRNQAGRIGIYVARDLDFSSVYELRPTQVMMAAQGVHP